MARIYPILLLVCSLPGAALPSFIAAKLISPSEATVLPNRVRSDPDDSLVIPGTPQPSSSETRKSESDSNSKSPDEQSDVRHESGGFSALRPTTSEAPEKNDRECKTNRFGESAREFSLEWSAGRTLMPARLGRVVAASGCDATEMSSIAPSILPFGPPAVM